METASNGKLFHCIFFFFFQLQQVIKTKLIHDEYSAIKKKKFSRSHFAPGRLRFLLLEKGEEGEWMLSSSSCTSRDFKHLLSPSQKWLARDFSSQSLFVSDRSNVRTSPITFEKSGTWGNTAQKNLREKHCLSLKEKRERD